MRAAALTLCLAAALALPAAAEETASLTLGGDSYAAGEDLRLDTATAGDLFAAGEAVEMTAPAGGAVHLAGRRVTVAAAPGGPLYAAGYTVNLRADLPGAATLFGAEVTVAGAVGGNLRLFAQEAAITGPVAGSALVAAQDVLLDAPVAGDLMLAAEDVDWRPGARVDGRVILYVEEAGAIAVPPSVAPPERVEERERDSFRGDVGPSLAELRRGAVRAAVLGFLSSVLVVAALATAAAAVAPERVAAWRETALARPGRSLGAGFLLLSTLVGAGVVLALTVIGLPLLPAFLLAAGLAGYAGYVLGSYILGVGIWLRLGNAAPAGVVQKAALAALGAVAAGLIGLIPLLGWLVILGLSLAGLGAITLHTRAARAA